MGNQSDSGGYRFWHFALTLVGCSLVAVTVGSIVYFLQLASSWSNDEFFDYERISALRDDKTGLFVEMGLMSSFSASILVVGVYPDTKSERRVSQLTNDLLELTLHSHNPLPERLEYDGSCYFVRADYYDFSFHIEDKWTNWLRGQGICFYLLTPNGKRYPQ